MKNALVQRLRQRAFGLLELIDSKDFPVRHDFEKRTDHAVKLDELRSLAESISHYGMVVEQKKHVGFVGHYSAGKSSTINSLVSGKVQNTDLNPTDKLLTLISSETTSKDIRQAIGGDRSGVGSRLVVKASDAPLLTDLILIDTPGSGDPGVMESIAQNYLPVCDLIVYVISAANPVDMADLTILRRVAERLNFIPHVFVITRADEFRDDQMSPLTEGNFDQVRFDGFLETLRNRLVNEFKLPEFEKSEFYTIDNLSRFRIGAFAEIVAAKDDKSAVRHAHVMEYFKTRFNGSLHEFINYVDGLGDIVGGLVAEVGASQATFDEVASTNKERVVEFWDRRAEQIGATIHGFRKTRDGWSEEIARAGAGFEDVNEFVDVALPASANAAVGERIEALAEGIVKDVVSKHGEAMIAAASHVLASGPLTPSAREELRRFEPDAVTLLSRRGVASALDEVSIFGGSLRATIVGNAQRALDTVGATVQSIATHVDAGALARDDQTAFEGLDRVLSDAVRDFRDVVQAYQSTALSRRASSPAEQASLDEELERFERLELSSERVAALRGAHHPLEEDKRDSFRSGFASVSATARSELIAMGDRLTRAKGAVDRLQRDFNTQFAGSEETIERLSLDSTARAIEAQREVVEAAADAICAGADRAEAAAEAEYQSYLAKKRGSQERWRRLSMRAAFVVLSAIPVYLLVSAALDQNLMQIVYILLGWIGAIFAAVQIDQYVQKQNTELEMAPDREEIFRKHRQAFVTQLENRSFSPRYDSFAARRAVRSVCAAAVAGFKSELLNSNEMLLRDAYAATKDVLDGVEAIRTAYCAGWSEYGRSLAEYYASDETRGPRFEALAQAVKQDTLLARADALNARKAQIDAGLKQLRALEKP